MRSFSTCLAIFAVFFLSAAARAKDRVVAANLTPARPVFTPSAGPPAGASTRSPRLPAGAGAAISRAIGADQAGYFARETTQGYRLDQGAMTLALSKDAARVVSEGKALTFRLTGYGRDGSVRGLPPVSPKAHANRVEYDRNGLIEWYTNGPAGIEQGFTIARSPAGTGRLRLEMTVSGEAVAAMDSDGQAASWRLGGKPWLRYAGLSVFDARGRELAGRLDLAGNRLSIEVHDSGAAYPVTVDPYFQEAKLTASDGAANDLLGYSVAISGDTVAAGAPRAMVGSNSYQGAAYVFVKPGGGWASTSTFHAKLTASDGAGYDFFGTSVAISGDTVVVGAPDATIGSALYQGAAYVFVKPVAGWASTSSFDAKLAASDGAVSDTFGTSVAISGGTIVAAAPGSNSSQGAAYVFVEPGTGWASTSTFDAKLTASDASNDQLGYSVAISGDTVVAATPYATIGSNSEQGAAYVFVEPETGWTSATQTAKLTASDGEVSDQLGYSVAISGDAVVAGAPFAMIGSNSEQGAAYVFVEPGTGWTGATQTAKLTASDGASGNQLGISVAISGDTVAAGAPGATIIAPIWAQGAAYVFVKPGTGWASTSTFDAKVAASDGAPWNQLGNSVAISGDTVVAATMLATIESNSSQGAAYVFVRGPCISSTTTVSNASTPSGVAVDLTATVTSSSTVTSGTVTFSVDGVEVGTANVVNGTATLLVAHQTLGSTGVYPNLSPGGYTIKADYKGTSFCASTDTGTLTVSEAVWTCPKTMQYWKDTPGEWPVSTLTLGTESYTKPQLIRILKKRSSRDASLVLSDELIAVKLNVALGSEELAAIATAISDADALLSQNPHGPVKPASTLGLAMIALADTLASYNDGSLTPGCTP
jgi:uncharacterized protein (DUF2345 family)